MDTSGELQLKGGIMKSGRRIGALAAFAMVTVVALTTTAGSVAAYDFPSTNEANSAAGTPHVELISAEPGNLVLRFATEAVGYGLIEYRVDGELFDGGYVIPLTGDQLQEHVCVALDSYTCADSVDGIDRAFAALEKVEVRLVMTDHPEWRFDWTPFEVDKPDAASGSGADVPETKDECRKGGWASFDFSNQGGCISYLMTSKNRR
jgi:hypothetical protein